MTTMADDLANNWGLQLCHPINKTSSAGRKAATSQQQSDGFDDHSVSALKDVVRATLDKEFELVKVASCGSDANLFALIEASNGNLNRCMVACGSYVAGTNGGLQSWSTSSFAVQYGPVVITHPSLVSSDFTRSNTVALPYHIFGLLPSQEIRAYEDEVLLELHIRCLIARMNNAPFKTLLMELCLAGSGARLSDRALTRIAYLSTHHGFSILLDEIMTGGRTGEMLMVFKTPAAFRNCVKFVTMGKWTGAGLVLAREASDWNDNPRGTSTKINCELPLQRWKTACEFLDRAAERRSQVLRHVKVDESQAWGIGAMVYVPKRRADLSRGLKNRLLPILNGNQIDNFRMTKRNDWSKEKINELVMVGVRAWVKNRAAIGSDDIMAKAIRDFVEHIAASDLMPGDTVKKVEFGTMFSEGTSRSTLRKVGKKAMKQALLQLKRKGKQRIETYIIQRLAVLPWNTLSLTYVDKPITAVGFVGGRYYVGDHIAEVTIVPPLIDCHDNTTVEPEFGKVMHYFPPETNGEHGTWIVRWDSHHETEEIGYSDLLVYLRSYHGYRHLDEIVTRYDGDKVAKIIDGSKIIFGTVDHCKEHNNEQHFCVKYDGSSTEEWVNADDVRAMRSCWKQHHLDNYTSTSSASISDETTESVMS